MFEGLDIPPNVYVTTASNAKESSWGTYCPPDDSVDGTHLKSCLGDLYSVNWMENADSVGKKETLQAQFEKVKTATSKSHVMQYGDQSFTSDPIGDYMGGSGVNATAKSVESHSSVNVDSRDIPLHLAYYNYIRADKTDIKGREALAVALHEEINHRMEADLIYFKLATTLADEQNFHEHVGSIANCGDCCKTVDQFIGEKCGGYSDYSLQYSRVVVNMCNLVSADKITSVLADLC
jgi:legumain